MSNEERPLIMMTVENTWCAEHLEPFRAEWPKGYMIANPLMMTAFAQLPDIQKYCESSEEPGKADVRKLNAALAEFGPVCCRIKRKDLDKIIEVALKGSPLLFHALHERLLGK